MQCANSNYCRNIIHICSVRNFNELNQSYNLNIALGDVFTDLKTL